MSFKYRKLNIVSDESFPIRLLRLSPKLSKKGRLQCSLIEAHVPKSYDRGPVTHPYKALSYTWGSEKPVKEIEIDGSLFNVRLNLWKFLNAARMKKGGREQEFWVDAVCINQEDLQERNAQVQRMGNIYFQAEEIVVWLGSGDKMIDNVLRVFSSWKFSETCNHYEDHEYAATISYGSVVASESTWDTIIQMSCSAHNLQISDFFEGLGKFMELEYWQRVWIIQEIYHARHIEVHYGSLTIPFTLLSCVTSHGYSYRQDVEGPRLPEELIEVPSRHAYHSIMFACCENWRAWDGTRRDEIRIFLKIFKSSCCSDVRDHVYGLRSMVARGYQLSVDYEEDLPWLLLRLLPLLGGGVQHVQQLFDTWRDLAKTLKMPLVKFRATILDCLNRADATDKVYGEAVRYAQTGASCIVDFMHFPYEHGVPLGGNCGECGKWVNFPQSENIDLVYCMSKSNLHGCHLFVSGRIDIEGVQSVVVSEGIIFQLRGLFGYFPSANAKLMQSPLKDDFGNSFGATLLLDLRTCLDLLTLDDIEAELGEALQKQTHRSDEHIFAEFIPQLLLVANHDDNVIEASEHEPRFFFDTRYPNPPQELIEFTAKINDFAVNCQPATQTSILPLPRRSYQHPKPPIPPKPQRLRQPRQVRYIIGQFD